jgi:DNA-directed RNA polymerase subunit F
MIKKWLKLKTKDIALVQFILEGYEGLATVTTIDRRLAVIQVAIMPDFESEMICILESLKKQFTMEDISCPLDRREPSI